MLEEGHGHVVVSRRSTATREPTKLITNSTQTIASSTAYHQAANGVACESRRCCCDLTPKRESPDLRTCPPPIDCSSKAAALSFHEGLTEELRHLYLPHSKARAVRTSVICPAHFKSGMFAGFVSGIPEFLAPSLEVDTVAEVVEKTILSGESQVSARAAGFFLALRRVFRSPGALAGACPAWRSSYPSDITAHHRAVLCELHPARSCSSDLDLRRHPRVRAHAPSLSHTQCQVAVFPLSRHALIMSCDTSLVQLRQRRYGSRTDLPRRWQEHRPPRRRQVRLNSVKATKARQAGL